MCAALDDVARGLLKRLMIFTQPRVGKTEAVSRRFPAFMFGKNPDCNVIATSYSDDLARANNRDVQRIITSDQYPLLFPNTRIGSTRSQSGVKNSDEFEVVGHRGVYKSAGVGGGITGRGFNIGLIDDPIKSREEADSKTYRERLWEWYNAVFYTRRANDDAAIILVQTRWHHDDLAGRLLAQNASEWTVVRFEAIKETNDAPNKYNAYDKRAYGDVLWPDLFSSEAMADTQKQLGTFNFASLYQQRPVPRSGNMFKTDRIKIIDNLPASDVVKSVRYWDKAGSSGKGCLSAGVLMCELRDRRYVVADVTAGQWSSLERETRMLQAARIDGRKTKIFYEQEPGSGGKESAESSARNLRGFIAKADRVTGAKDSRAEPFAAQVEAGNVMVLNRPWTKDYLDELEMYPNGKFLDRTDASAGAFNKLCKNRITPHVGTSPTQEEVAVATNTNPMAEFEDILSQANNPEERAELERILRAELEKSK
jgi:predicted phage terminase large subunit-like protein